MKPDLSIIIPARNEMFLTNTVADILKNIRGDTEIIVVLDGAWPTTPIPQHDKVTVLYYPESIGQRAAVNRGVKLSSAKYVMKLDAHCSFDEGFDVKMMADMQDDWTMVPLMKNLHVFDWVCKKCGDRRYQGPKPTNCSKCDVENLVDVVVSQSDLSGDNKSEFEMDIVWRAKPSPNSTSYRFTKELRFKYFGEYKARQVGDLVESMSLQGSCFMATREKYWDLGLCDESWGSWGQQGTEVALKTWLSGGRVICNKKTWYAHLFRTQKGFTWPYPQPGKSQQNAIRISQDLFFNNKWPKAKYPLDWLIKKFSPVPDWEAPLSVEPETKGIVFYTDNCLALKIARAVQKRLRTMGLPIVSASLKPMPHFGTNVHLKRKRGYLTMFRQILAGLEASESEIIFFCEHDVFYHPSHFEFTPEKRDVFYYNENVWKMRAKDGHAIHYPVRQTSGLCAYRELLIKHYRKRIERVEAWGYSTKIGFEPGTHNRKERIDNYKSEGWMSDFPNIDIRHNGNLTPSRWSPDDFRNKPKSWEESSDIPGWGKTKDAFKFLMG